MTNLFLGGLFFSFLFLFIFYLKTSSSFSTTWVRCLTCAFKSRATKTSVIIGMERSGNAAHGMKRSSPSDIHHRPIGANRQHTPYSLILSARSQCLSRQEVVNTPQNISPEKASINIPVARAARKSKRVEIIIKRTLASQRFRPTIV